MEITPTEVATVAAAACEHKGGTDPVVIDVSEVLVVTDLFVITSAKVARQVKAISDAVEEALTDYGLKPRAIEGLDTAQWVLMDYGSVVVHVLDEKHRELYQLERLWGDCPTVDTSALQAYRS